MVVASPRRVARAVDVRAGWQQRGEPAWEVVEVEGGVRMGELFDAFFAAEARRSGSGWVAWGEVAWGWPGGGGVVSPDWQGLGGLGRVDLVLTKGGECSLWLEKGRRAGAGEEGGAEAEAGGLEGPRQETFGSSEWQYRCEEFDATRCLAWP